MRVLTEEVKANISQEQPAEAKTALAESWNSLFSLRGCISQPFDERGSSWERNTVICNITAKNLKSITAFRSIINAPMGTIIAIQLVYLKNKVKDQKSPSSGDQKRRYLDTAIKNDSGDVKYRMKLAILPFLSHLIVLAQKGTLMLQLVTALGALISNILALIRISASAESIPWIFAIYSWRIHYDAIEA
uniref:Uncharacterized protein n=1 Tax=Glossina brevipalpis TaxID=37001 RepID=A0A1A9W1C5_9MUSC